MTSSGLVTSDTLDALDDALGGVRRLWERPTAKRWFLQQLRAPVELATVRTLRAIESSPMTPSIGDIAEALAVDPSTASRLVDRALALGYATRQEGTDRRRSRIHLTSSGRRLLVRATIVRRRWLAEATADWELEDIRRLTQLLDELSRNVERLEFEVTARR